MNRHYELFARFIAANQEANNRDAILHVMRASGGSASPDLITDWWNQWQELQRQLTFYGFKADER